MIKEDNSSFYYYQKPFITCKNNDDCESGYGCCAEKNGIGSCCKKDDKGALMCSSFNGKNNGFCKENNKEMYEGYRDRNDNTYRNMFCITLFFIGLMTLLTCNSKKRRIY